LGILNGIIFLPVIGAIMIILIPHLSERMTKFIAAGFSLAALILAIVLFVNFDRSQGAIGVIQFETQITWIKAINAYYHTGVDGVSLPLLALTTLLGFLAVLISWKMHRRVREYFAWLLVLETSIIGVFTALDFLLFFLFWEIEIIPMYFLISIWGTGRKDYSALKYVIFTLLGSAFMLSGIFALYVNTGSLNMVEIASRIGNISPVIPLAIPFAFLLIGFAVKLPVFPLHTWLPDAHTDAPTGVSVMLAGALLKMGGYGMIRVSVNIFPDLARQFAPFLIIPAVIGIVYGAVLTLRQNDIKRMIAYSSISHMGYVLLGIFTLSQVSLVGASLQMVSHGLVTGLLFAAAGLIMHNTKERDLDKLGGLAAQTPAIAIIFIVAGCASLGLPLTSGFAAEFMVFLGSFTSNIMSGIKIYTIIGALGVVLAAGYILMTVQRVFYGPRLVKFDQVKDADKLELVYSFVFIGLILLIGIYPSIITNLMSNGIAPLTGLIAH
jgi:NADH-quinone oxidoreductase subunit M